MGLPLKSSTSQATTSCAYLPSCHSQVGAPQTSLNFGSSALSSRTLLSHVLIWEGSGDAVASRHPRRRRRPWELRGAERPLCTSSLNNLCLCRLCLCVEAEPGLQLPRLVGFQEFHQCKACKACKASNCGLALVTSQEGVSSHRRSLKADALPELICLDQLAFSGERLALDEHAYPSNPFNVSMGGAAEEGEESASSVIAASSSRDAAPNQYKRPASDCVHLRHLCQRLLTALRNQKTISISPDTPSPPPPFPTDPAERLPGAQHELCMSAIPAGVSKLASLRRLAFRNPLVSGMASTRWGHCLK